MSGHSHWANIKYKKEREDQKRGKIFSRASRQITQLVREGGADPEFNLPLQAAIEEAKRANMSKDRIRKAIEAGVVGLPAGKAGKSGSGAQEILEGYGPGGIAFLVRVETDNKNRTLSEVRRVFASFGGSLGEAGSAAFVFEAGRPKFKIELSGGNRERAEKMINSLEEHPDVVEVLTNAKF